jgi:hypothetical protein
MSRIAAKDLTEKACKTCNITQSIDNFYKQKAYNKDKTYDTWDCYCKKCRIEYSVNRRRSDKTAAIEYLGGKCVDCGEDRNIPALYDFHHLDPSKKDFSIGKSALVFESLKKELDKCILLCSNCHRIRHYNESINNL